MIEPRNESDEVGLETRNLFLDTEVFSSQDYKLDTKLMKILGQYVADGVFVLHTTDVTLREVNRKLADMEKRLTKRANRVAEELNDWNSRYRYSRHRLAVPDRLSRPAPPTQAYRDFQRTLRHDWQTEVHCSANLYIGPVLDQYFSGRAPFDTQGSKEFPDAIALLALEKWCASKQERIYVVSKDKAVLRAADQSPHLIGIQSLDRLLSQLTSAQDHDVSDVVWAALNDEQLLNAIRDSLSTSLGSVEGIYDGEKYDGEVSAIEVVELEEVEEVTILRVEQDQVALIAQIKLVVSAEVEYTDLTCAMWDREDQRYYGADSAVEDVEDSVEAKIIVELRRIRGEIALSSAQFLNQSLTITDSDGYPFK